MNPRSGQGHDEVRLSAAEARSRQQAQQQRRRQAEAALMAERFGAGPLPGRLWPNLGVAGIAVQAVSGLAALAAPSEAVDALLGAATVVALTEFVLGSGLLAVALVAGIGRSRTQRVTFGGLVLGVGSAPRALARTMWVSLAVQVVVSIGLAAAKPFSSMAFQTLAPVWCLATATAWSAWHGWFPERDAQPRDGQNGTF